MVQPGEQTQTITVTGEIPSIDTTDATLGGTVSNQSINSLPLNGRNFQRLIQLRPGVVTPVGSGTGAGQSTNGRRTQNDMLRLEGIAGIAESTGANVLNTSYRRGTRQVRSYLLMPFRSSARSKIRRRNMASGMARRSTSASNRAPTAFMARPMPSDAMPTPRIQQTFSPETILGGSRLRPWSSSGRRRADALSRISSSGLRVSRACASRSAM